MSDSPPERNSNSKSNLIEVQHVGVTAKLQSPLKSLLQTSSSSTETEHNQIFYNTKTNKYNKLSNGDTQLDTESNTDTSKVLYEMRAIRSSTARPISNKVTPSKIEFQLYNKPTKRRHNRNAKVPTKKKSTRRNLFSRQSKMEFNETIAETSLLQRLRHSLGNMRSSKPQKSKHNIFDDLPEPSRKASTTPPLETRIGIYPFEHGCAEYLRTTDCHPQILSIVLAERATHYATRFWAEFFGTLHIGVAFVVTFALQSYRFLLYSLVNTLLVGFLHMTSDYLIKPILTVIFNGFLQPPLVLIFNILTSIRDILEPIADTVNNFLKPIGNVLKNVRLVHATYSNRKISKNV